MPANPPCWDVPQATADMWWYVHSVGTLILHQCLTSLETVTDTR